MSNCRSCFHLFFLSFPVSCISNFGRFGCYIWVSCPPFSHSHLAVGFLHIAFLRSPNPLSPAPPGPQASVQTPSSCFSNSLVYLSCRLTRSSVFRWTPLPPAAQSPSCGLVSSAHVHSFISLFVEFIKRSCRYPIQTQDTSPKRIFLNDLAWAGRNVAPLSIVKSTLDLLLQVTLAYRLRARRGRDYG